MVKVALVEGRIKDTIKIAGPPDRGAELVFRGRVRGSEGEHRITALYYEHYPGMAEQKLKSLAEKTAELYPIGDLICRHRIGEIPVGEASMEVSIWSSHRREALQAMEFFIAEVKKSVPIWKWAILPGGAKVPSDHHSQAR